MLLAALVCALSLSAAPPTTFASPVAPSVTSTTTYRLRQTVRLDDIPAGTGRVRLWVPVPSDTAWQRVLDVSIVDLGDRSKVRHLLPSSGWVPTDIVADGAKDAAARGPTLSPPQSGPPSETMLVGDPLPAVVQP